MAGCCGIQARCGQSKTDDGVCLGGASSCDSHTAVNQRERIPGPSLCGDSTGALRICLTKILESQGGRYLAWGHRECNRSPISTAFRRSLLEIPVLLPPDQSSCCP